MGGEERRQAMVADFVRPEFEPGEQLIATLTSGQTGPHPGYGLALGGIFAGATMKMKAVCVTDRQVFVVARSSWSGRLLRVENKYPKASVGLHEFTPGQRIQYGTLALKFDDEVLNLRIHWKNRGGATAVAGALRSDDLPWIARP